MYVFNFLFTLQKDTNMAGRDKEVNCRDRTKPIDENGVFQNPWSMWKDPVTLTNMWNFFIGTDRSNIPKTKSVRCDLILSHGCYKKNLK